MVCGRLNTVPKRGLPKASLQNETTPVRNRGLAFLFGVVGKIFPARLGVAKRRLDAEKRLAPKKRLACKLASPFKGGGRCAMSYAAHRLFFNTKKRGATHSWRIRWGCLHLSASSATPI